MPATYMKKTNDNKLLYIGNGELVYYIPEKYFDINIAVVNGAYIDCMGIFSYAVFNNAGKLQRFSRFKYPTMIKCKPSEITKEKGYLLQGTSEPKDYRILHFKEGDELVCNLFTAQNIVNVEKFMGLLMRANLPDDIPYEELHDYINMNAQLNGFSYGVTSQLIGVIVSEICRDSKDLSKPYRNTNMDNQYKAIPMTKIPKYISPYTAVTSENADEAVAAAMTLKSNTESPLEKVMMQ